MKILLVQDGDWIKKGPHQQHHLIELMSTRGHSINIIGFDQMWREEKGFYSKLKIYKNVKMYYDCSSIDYYRASIIRAPLLDVISYAVSSFFLIRKLIIRDKPDVLISFTSVLSSFWCYIFGKIFNIPFFYYWTDYTHSLIENRLLRIVSIGVEIYLLRNTNNIITINEDLSEKIRNLSGKNILINTITGGIDLERFQTKDNSVMMRKLGISQDDNVLLFMGWVYPFSGLMEIVDQIITGKYKNVKLIIIGKSHIFDDILNKVRNSNNENVIMIPWVPYDEIPGYLSISKFCILPAHYNDVMNNIVPIKIYEYLASGKPVICTRLQGIVKEFGDHSGLIYIEKPTDILERIEYYNAIYDKKVLEAEKFIKQYDWSTILTKFEKLLIDEIS